MRQEVREHLPATKTSDMSRGKQHAQEISVRYLFQSVQVQTSSQG